MTKARRIKEPGGMRVLELARVIKGACDTSIFAWRPSRTVLFLLFLACGKEMCGPAPVLAQGAQSSPVPPAAKTTNEKAGKPRTTGSLRIASVGDIIAGDSFGGIADTDISAAMKIIAKSDVGFGNMEGNLLDLKKFKGYPEAENGGMWLIAPPQIAEDLRAAGFRMLARANNHSTEWGRDGMRETDRALDKAGISHAGTGENRAAARAAAYLTTAKGKFSMVSMASSFTASSVAAPKQPEIVARPGMNAIRTEEFHIVSREMMDGLVQISESQREKSASAGVRAAVQKPEKLELFGVSYRVGSEVGESSFEMNPTDVAENLLAIREGKKHSDFLIATIHTHEPGNWSQEPPDFLVELAHQCIDVGADEFSGHGPHQLRGIEIYKGKPIFYSLGNFIFEVEEQKPVPLEMYEALGQDLKRTSNTELDRVFVKKYLDSVLWYQSVIAVSQFDHGRLAEIRLYPVELGFSTQDGRRGLPRIAPPAVAQEILRRLRKLSEAFHTQIEIEENVGVIRLPSH
jgi:poly-gamma-glutamate capsule biosynthesis protein CapA/YwtB (metallophosphatase superfamily)